MQGDRALKFWNDYHTSNGEKEWILQPTREVFDLVRTQSVQNAVSKQEIRIIEIGCGTSSMARDLLVHFQERGSDETVHLYATDASSVCVEACFQRDRDIQGVYAADCIPQSKNCSSLHYCTLNVLEDLPDQHQSSWDVILDKACLDTFLFRTRQRGENKVYPAVVLKALNNIWTMLAENGTYILISPRSKLKAVRDFAGFSSVNRLLMDAKSKGDKVQSNSNASRKESNICYIYICRKDVNYIPSVTKPFTESYRDLPTETSKCPHCDLVFSDFRKGEDVDGRGLVFWSRQWKNHRIHCKAPHKLKWSS